jgi:hypothetical protein
MTFTAAAKVLAAHDMQSRPSDKPGPFEGLMISTDRAGAVFDEWEPIALTTSAIRDWLGH